MSILQRRLVRLAAAAVAVVGWGAVLVAPTGASAAIVTTPVGLSPGDQYRLAFVTSEFQQPATSSDIADYNALVTTAANSQTALFTLGATWKAIGSTSTVDARDNTSTNPNISIGVPIYLLDGTKIADSNADLWDGTIDSPFNIFEDGSPAPTPFFNLAWTGTAQDGTGFNNFYLGDLNSVVGFINLANSGWVTGSFDDTILSAHRLYALSSQLTVAPVPLPGALILFSSGLVCLAVLRCRNRSVRPA